MTMSPAVTSFFERKESTLNFSKKILSAAMLLLVGTIPLHGSDIHDAVNNNDLEMIRTLLDGDPSLINERNADGMTPLNLAAFNGNYEIAEELLNRNADIHIGDFDNSQPIHLAAISGNVQIAELLLTRGANINEQDNNGATPLGFAAGRRHIDMVRYLLERDADVGIRNTRGMTPLFYAGTPEIAALMLDRGADVNARSNDGGTPLIAATWRGRVELIRYLLERGADPNFANDAGITPLFAVNGDDIVQIAQMLIKRGARVNVRNDRNETPLHNIAWTGSKETAELLLSEGADINAVGDGGWTPLCMAALGNAEITKYLVSKGAAVNPHEPEDAKECPCRVEFQTPLHCAVRSDSLSTVQVLVQNGATVNIVDAEGMTPLHLAVKKGNAEIVKYLIDHDAVINVKEGHYGANEMHVAAATGQKEIAALLIENDVDINAKDNAGKTPLHYATYHEFRGIHKMLAENSDTHEKVSRLRGGSGELLNEKLKTSEALIWYLGHSGWAIKTRSHLLIFDYNAPLGSIPDDASLSSGYIIPPHIKDQNITVFVTHAHGDHYNPSIFNWQNDIADIQYVLGFQPRDIENEYVYTAPRTETALDDMKVTTIRSNDGGVGFLIEVDDLVIFHQGDHANGSMDMSGNYTPEIDAIASMDKDIDLAFGPILGCSLGTPESVQLGAHYAIETLSPNVFMPMHSGQATYRYRDFVEEAAERDYDTQLAYALVSGDRFLYRHNKITKVE
jgi:ankyrin repeat protein/L-ascorbate metabolism protein UlaG (beta-lactamase superfamily)